MRRGGHIYKDHHLASLSSVLSDEKQAILPSVPADLEDSKTQRLPSKRFEHLAKMGLQGFALRITFTICCGLSYLLYGYDQGIPIEGCVTEGC